MCHLVSKITHLLVMSMNLRVHQIKDFISQPP